MQDLILIYEGSVKRVWKPETIDDILWFEYTDDYSVFDWGKMPDTILNKGRALAALGAFFFLYLERTEIWASLPGSENLRRFDRQWQDARWSHRVYKAVLSRHGAPHHFKGLVKGDGQPAGWKDVAGKGVTYLQALPAAVFRPEPYQLIAETVYYYSRRPVDVQRRLVPLEVVFRFGMPPGSSLKRRLEENPDYALILGLTKPPREGEWFAHPVIELFTKLEPKDRLLSVQEALLISGLSPEEFEAMIELSYDAALALYDLFSGRGIELWDGKFEFITGEEGLMIADSIGPDELRLVYKGHNLSKEMIRQVYRGSRWESSLKEAQALATEKGRPEQWRQIARTRLKVEPEPLPADFKSAIDKLYGVIANHVIGENIFANHPALDEFVKTIPGTHKGT
jgi:phosphoribosylaminoimidazole-succinocarboxamide synthase